MTKRKWRGKQPGRPRKPNAPRHPGGEVKRDRDRSLPPPEVMARREALVGSALDQRAGYIFGIMLARKDITLDEHNAGLAYGERCAAYEALIGVPRGFGTRPEGRSLSPDDPARWEWVDAEMMACRAALKHLDHRCIVALSRAVHDQPEALQWPTFVQPALAALHEAQDAIKRAGRAAVENWRKEAA